MAGSGTERTPRHDTRPPSRVFGVRRRAGRVRGVSLAELLIVLLLIVVLTTISASQFVNARRAAYLGEAAAKIDKVFATARSYAIASEDRYYQVTFWNDGLTNPGERFWFWIDEIEWSDPTNMVAATVVTADGAKIVHPEKMNDMIDPPFGQANALAPPNTITGGIGIGVTNTIVFRFFPDGTSDDGAVYLIRKTADPAVAKNYTVVRLYGPTARSRIIEREMP